MKRSRGGLDAYAQGLPGFYVVNPRTNLAVGAYADREGAVAHVGRVQGEYPEGDPMEIVALIDGEKEDRHLADGEAGYWRECYRDQLRRANGAESKALILRAALVDAMATIGQVNSAGFDSTRRDAAEEGIARIKAVLVDV